MDLLVMGSIALCGGRLRLTNLIEYFEEVAKMIDEGRAMDVVYIAFRKAFDKVPLGMLIEKKSHGIHSKMVQNWLGHGRQSTAGL